jgi:hypothetical protein
VIFAIDRTLLNFFIHVDLDARVPHFHKNFLARVSCVLVDLRITDKNREYLLDEYRGIGFAPTQAVPGVSIHFQLGGSAHLWNAIVGEVIVEVAKVLLEVLQ